MQLPRSLAVTMEMFVLLEGQTRGRGGWKYALEECGGPCVIIVGTPMMLVWCAGSLDLKWTVEHVRSSQNNYIYDLHQLAQNSTTNLFHIKQCGYLTCTVKKV